jgi:hypothetical protein
MFCSMIRARDDGGCMAAAPITFTDKQCHILLELHDFADRFFITDLKKTTWDKFQSAFEKLIRLINQQDASLVLEIVLRKYPEGNEVRDKLLVLIATDVARARQNMALNTTMWRIQPVLWKSANALFDAYRN